jgi:GNAT superfamily N-acetyltransferase
VAGRVVAAGSLELPLLDNPDLAALSVHVVPDERRRGHGTALARRLEQEARERGRTLLVAETAWPFAGGPDGAGRAGPEFARRLGYALALGDVKRILRLPVCDRLLDDLAAEAAPHHAAYTLHSWAGPVPDALLDGWAALTAVLGTEAPTGDLEVEPENIDAVAVREAEALVARQGRRKYNTVALDENGEVVAYTDIATTVHEPDRAYQWGTLVRRDARGHRLGLAVKVANLRLLQDSCPDVRLLTTYNAEVNARMVEVNERLGFVPVARLGEFQKRLA